MNMNYKVLAMLQLLRCTSLPNTFYTVGIRFSGHMFNFKTVNLKK